MILNNSRLLGFAAYSGTGKTTLLEKVIPLLTEKGQKIAIIKHAHHNFDIDYPGKDSYRLRKAGAIETIVASKHRWAHIHENQGSNEKFIEEPDLFSLLKKINTSSMNLILVEGFKHEAIPRIELHRSCLNNPFLYPDDDKIIAIATDATDPDWGETRKNNLTILDINNPQQIAHYILINFCERNKP